MIKKSVSIVVLLLLCAGHITAKKVEADKAERIASRFVSGFSSGNNLRSSAALQLAYTATASPASGLRAAGSPLLYIYNVSDNGGFVIVSGDDGALPVLAYSDTGRFQSESMPDNLKGMLAHYEEEISSWINNGYAASEETLRQWNALLNANVRIEPPSVLLETALWNQTSPYNDLCPQDSGKQSVTGCVATAMGIAMKYYRYPQKGQGEVSYKTFTKRIPVSADFNVEYDWDNMLDEYKTDNNNPLWNADEGNAVATLLFHCGSAAFMDYQYAASGSSTFDAVAALIKNFSYDSGAYEVSRVLYTAEEWDALLQQELNEARVVLYCGVSKEGTGHLMVIDGYNTQGYYHVNWGWGGTSNGLYLLSSLEPQTQGVGGNKEGSGYALYQSAIIGLQEAQESSSPNHEIYFLELEAVGETPGENPFNFKVRGLSTNVNIVAQDKPFLIRFSYLMDYGQRDFDGEFGFFIFDKDNQLKDTLGVFPYQLGGHYLLYDREGEEYTITSDVEAGDRIRMYYTSNKTDWKPVRGTGNTTLEIPIGVPIATASESGPVQTGDRPLVTTDGSVVQVHSSAPIREISIFDITGSLVGQQNYGAYPSDGKYDVSFSINDLSSGIYIISVQTADGRSEQKILKR
jgi:hypothetical protein